MADPITPTAATTADFVTTLAIRAVALTKRYGDVTALDAVNLSVARGELYGFLGRNGAGKTTTIRLLLGMVGATSGHVEVLGERVGRVERAASKSRTVGSTRGGRVLWGRVGYLVEAATAYPELSVRENLEVARRLQGLRDDRAVQREIDRFGLAPFAERRAGTLSTGNLQRLALARALLHEPELIILDEPTVGLDPAGVVEVRDLLRSLVAERGVTLFMSSHALVEVERLATRVGVVHGGRLVAELSAEELARRRGRQLEVGARDPGAAEAALRGAGYSVRRGHSNVVLRLNDPRALDRPEEVARLLVEAGAPPTRLALVQEDMESFFLALTGEGGGSGP